MPPLEHGSAPPPPLSIAADITLDEIVKRTADIQSDIRARPHNVHPDRARQCNVPRNYSAAAMGQSMLLTHVTRLGKPDRKA